MRKSGLEKPMEMSRAAIHIPIKKWRMKLNRIMLKSRLGLAKSSAESERRKRRLI